MTAELDLPVILVDAIADWSDAHAADLPRRDLGRFVLPVSDLRRSAEFYRRVFGFWPRRSGLDFVSRDGDVRVLSARRRAELELVQRSTRRVASQNRRWAFVVADLEEVREQVWELGVEVARDSGEPDHIFRRRGSASLYVRDPDGNEIELVELTAPRDAQSPACGSRMTYAHRAAAIQSVVEPRSPSS